MALKYLVGPVSARRAAEAWTGPRAAGACRAFNATGDLDLAIGPQDRWEDILAKLPADWRPDLVVLEPAYRCVPPGLWQARVPLVALAADWNLLWHGYRHLLPLCDRVLTDSAGVEVMRRQGWTHARAANLYGPERVYLDLPADEGERDIDVLFVGNLHPAVQRGRLPWLGRVARLAAQRHVVIRAGIYGDDYRALLRRAKIVFNRSVRGECNQRTFEAAAAGALLFQEAGNAEVADFFEPGTEYVAYSDDDLETLLEHYLTHENERRGIAAAARRRVQGYGSEALWQRTLSEIESEWDELLARAARRQAPGSAEQLLCRSWEALSAVAGSDPALASDLAAASRSGPNPALLHNAAGIAEAQAGRGAQSAGRHFRAALDADPRHPVAALNLIEDLVDIGQRELAAEGARRLLTMLGLAERLEPDTLDSPHYPPAFDLFRVEWERAAWWHAGDPAGEARAKADLLRWRLHDLLGGLTGDSSHHHEAALARPDLPSSRAALGCALGRTGRAAIALPHLRAALEANPFDNPAARALAQALSDAGDRKASHRLARDRRVLHKAAPQAVRAEAWFAEAPPVGDELASVVILCHNELEYTRLCLESVLAATRAPYELVVVDNASTDGTPAYLEELRNRSGPERIVIFRNEDNKGFPAGCNQGLAAARGEYLVFLNNDTVVTAGWLDGLIDWSLIDWPRVGLVGAVTNATRAPQQVEAGYADLAGLPAFAASRRKQFAGKMLSVERLTGFCLLARREVLDRVGSFDEGFGTGFFEDDDLSVRTLRAGYRLLVALNVYIHHFGSRTFAALGVDCPKALRENFEKFRAKWGPEHTAGYRLPGGAPASSGAPADAPTAVVTAPSRSGKARVSLCLIVKNEEANLPGCLGSAADLVDEVVVIDTGSQDATKEIAARYGARLFDFPWCDSFSAARNESLRHATGDWIFWLDADDRIDEDNRAKLRTLFAELGNENAAYAMKCLCLPDAATGTSTVVDHIRLFRNRPDVRWTYRVHEQILPGVRKAGGEVRWSDVVIRHTGYQDPALRRRKLERDLRILKLEDAERPGDAFTLFNFGQVAQELGRHADAIPLLRRSLEKSHPKDSIVRKLYALIAGCHRQLGQSAEALAACRQGRVHYPDDAELLFVEAMLLREKGDLPGAEACLRRSLAAPSDGHFASVDAGLRGYKARQNLAVVCQQQGRHDEAEAHFRQVLADRPDFLPGWIGLGEMLLAGKRWVDLDEAATQLGSVTGGAVESALLRARGHLARREFKAARTVLERAIAEAPRALAPRVVLSHVFLQEGSDTEAAENALLSVLELAPEHAEARNNLAVLRRDRERTRATADAVFSGNVGGAELYFSACRCDHPLRDYLPALVALARGCQHITDVGTGIGLAAAAFLYADPARLLCIDRVKYPEVDRLRLVAGRTEFTFRQTDVLWDDLEETDLLFLDTWHVYGQLSEELRLHADKSRRYVVIHGTGTFGNQGEDAGHRGLLPAVEEFLAKGTFLLKERRTEGSGLTILERVERPATSPEAP
jgi:glycosyltransferase involved in cell wall biosynthesis/Flp pilus assembly protein TadD